MCGINGVTGKNERLVLHMNEATKHRGPDATAVWTDNHITLGANRLAIIDLSQIANQPIHSADGRYTIVFNGEIYNYRELREGLKYSFKTQGDTEVVLALFMRDGAEAFSRLNGMFALAIWDSFTSTLTLARDQAGVKPLYYRQEGKSFAFSSEVKGILADSKVPRRIDGVSLERYLRLRYVPEPDTMVEGIKKLPPASYAVFRDGDLLIKRYFEPALQPLTHMKREDIEARVRELIDASVKRQLISDRPLGLFLSGGLDSTIVLDAAVKAAGTIETFSLAFELKPHEQPEKFNADAQIAQKTAQHYGASHHEIMLSEKDFVRMLPDAIRYLDQPLANATAIAQLALSRFARQKIVVALAGDGGDELFGGYPRYRLSRLMDIYQHIPSVFRTPLAAVSERLEKLNVARGISRVELFMFEKDVQLRSAVATRFITDTPRDWFDKQYLHGRNEADFTQLFMDVDRRSWLIDEGLARTDTMTMGASLEARVPLLDPELITFASSLPSSARVGLTANKRILRSAFRARLPAHVLNAEKRGFFSPTAKWLRRPHMLTLAREVLTPGYHSGTDSILAEGASLLLEDHLAGKYAMNTLWTLISFRLWAKEFNMSL